MEREVPVVDSADQIEPTPQGSSDGLKPGEIRVTPNGDRIVIQTRRWAAILLYRRYADGSIRIGDRLFRPPAEGSSAQWGRTGQGGGGGGRSSGGGGGGAKRVPEMHRPPYTAVGTPPELRNYPLPEEVRRRLDFISRGAAATSLAKASTRVVVRRSGGGNPDASRRGGRPKPKSRRGRTEDQ